MDNESTFPADKKTVLMFGCFDSKGEDFSYLHACLKAQEINILTMNTGTYDSTASFDDDVIAAEVADVSGTSLDELRKADDRGLAVTKMGEGAAFVIAKLVKEVRIDGAISMGGGGGTYIALSAMQAMPFGMPKLCLSTIATKDLSRQIGAKDITLMPSIVDVAGLNSISRVLISQAAGSIAGMVASSMVQYEKKTGSIAISMFGNTTECVEICTKILKEKGYDVLTFHSVGVGGRTMESLILDDCFDAVLDITTTELADDLCEGICSAGPDRLTAAAKMGIPQVVVPGCLDMVNYGHKDTVPEKYKSRELYSWAPDVTLMRTNEEENRTLGLRLAEKLNASKGPVTIILPLKGISKVSSEGGVFYRPEVDRVLFDSIKEKTSEHISIVELEANINEAVFAEHAVAELLAMLGVN
ncbi:MAG: Tm-1-like ATP-binding domain-containing protein [Cyclobacteriaceae bacterium]